jgi:hypothetical protein
LYTVLYFNGVKISDPSNWLKMKTMPIHNLMLLFCVGLSFANLLDAKVLNRNPTFEKGKQGWFGKREVVEVEVNGQVESVLTPHPEIDWS